MNHFASILLGEDDPGGARMTGQGPMMREAPTLSYSKCRAATAPSFPPARGANNGNMRTAGERSPGFHNTITIYLMINIIFNNDA